MKKKLKGYIYSRKFMGEIVPQKVQNIIIKNYCEKNNCDFILSSVEYSMENCYLVLKKLIDNLKSYNGIAFYSLYQLPYHEAERFRIYDLILKKKKELHFVLEEVLLTINCTKNLETIESSWQIRKTLNKINFDLAAEYNK
jgi:sporadic carbohydrate cluster protein (TIGR04323 family)